MSLSCVERGWTIPSQDILAHSDQLNVLRLDASAVTTEMIGLKERWDRADHRLVSETMATYAPVTAIYPTAYTKVSVTLGASAHPLPASVLRDANLRPKACGQTGIANSNIHTRGLSQ